ncbi:hypothetical protein B0H16DRAFT_909050 [Mycena metata]|uniref:F-box domain-containing protein n=1 Tax=Mycena metata TaxID=1033252 RepID=A0AAD7DJX6_9AGAR|nr:hypothetical protein B0H16DRAFT_909050 [Mycena metata]
MNRGMLPLEMYKESLGYLLSSELGSAALASRELRRIAQSLMFRELWVDDESIDPHSRDKILQRIAFYTSEHIARTVRACHLRTNGDWAGMSEEIFIAVFAAFHHFNHLRTVSIQHTDNGACVRIDSKTRMNSPLQVFVHSHLSGVRLALLCSRNPTNLVLDWDEDTDSEFARALTDLGPLAYLRKLTIFPRSLTQASLFEAFLRLAPRWRSSPCSGTSTTCG